MPACIDPLRAQDLVVVYRRAAHGGLPPDATPALELRILKDGRLSLPDRDGRLRLGFPDLVPVLANLDALAELPPPGFLAADADKVDFYWRTDGHPRWRVRSYTAPLALARRDPRYGCLESLITELERAAALARAPRPPGRSWGPFELPDNFSEVLHGNRLASDKRKGVR